MSSSCLTSFPHTSSLFIRKYCSLRSENNSVRPTLIKRSVRPLKMKGTFISAVFLSLVIHALCNKVFVYGTLKKGQSNYHEMTNTTHGQAEFITCARTVEPYPMVIATEDKYPFLLNVPGSGQQVYGEIYDVDQKMLEFLDWFEECPELYQRTLIQLEILKKNGEYEKTSVYSTSTFDPDWLSKPTLPFYDATGDPGHGCVPPKGETG